MNETDFIDYFRGVLGFKDENLMMAALCGYRYGHDAGVQSTQTQEDLMKAYETPLRDVESRVTG